MSPAAKRTRTSPRAGPSMDQFEKLVASVDELKSLVMAGQHKKKDEEDEEEADEGEAAMEEEEDIVLFSEDMTYEQKYHIVRNAIPVKTYAVFKAIISDPDGSKCLLWALQLALNKAVAEEGATYDTSSNSSALASKLIHVLFAIEYVKRYKGYDPRENYVQHEGTAMGVDVYEWMKEALTFITEEFYQNFQMESRFSWDAFYAKFRVVWRWTRSNNSDNRRARRRLARQRRQ